MLDQLRISKRTMIITTLVVLGVIALLIRLPFLGYESGDYKDFLLPWYDHLSQYGFGAFREAFANYNFPYLYILWLLSALHLPPLISIKVVSFLFEIAMAVAIYLIVRHYRPKGSLPVFAAVGVLYLPTVFMNSSVWAQCDSIYAALVLYAFYAILKDKRVLMWVAWGIAIAFKVQAIFFLPVLVYVWLTSKQSKLYDPFLGLLPFAVSCLPALLVGQPLDSVLATYAVQAGYYPYLSANAPSIYGLMGFGPVEFIRIGQLLTLAVVGGLIMLAVYMAKRDSGKRYLLAFAALVVAIVPYLLPQMHERYFYLAEVFTFMLAIVSWRAVWMAAVIQAVSAVMYMVQFYATSLLPFGLPTMSVLMGTGVLGLLYYFLRYFTTISFEDRFVNRK